MELSEGIKQQGRSIEIPDCGRSDLPIFFKQLGFGLGVEVGVYRGEYTEILAKSNMSIVGVDPWLAYDGYPYYDKRSDQWRHDDNLKQAEKRLASYSNVTLLRKTSMQALENFPENSIDFVYIDGNHSFRYVAEDICEWTKKVKPGGFVCGHDYIYSNPKSFHVRYVVDAYVESHAVKNLWILGRKHLLAKGEIRDEWRSWMFRKDE